MPKRPSPATKSNIWNGLIQASPEPALKKKGGLPSLPDHNVPVDFDEEFFNTQAELPYNEKAASKLLSRINEYLEDNTPLPYGIRDYLYRAFKATILAEPKKRPIVLASSLGLIRGQQRPRSSNPDEIGRLVAKVLLSSKSEAQAIGKVADEKNLSKTIVRNHYKQYLAFEADCVEVLKRSRASEVKSKRQKSPLAMKSAKTKKKMRN